MVDLFSKTTQRSRTDNRDSVPKAVRRQMRNAQRKIRLAILGHVGLWCTHLHMTSSINMQHSIHDPNFRLRAVSFANSRHVIRTMPSALGDDILPDIDTATKPSSLIEGIVLLN